MKNLAEILIENAVKKGDLTAFRLYEENGGAVTDISWRDLEVQTRKLASVLKSFSPKGERVILFCPTGFDFIAGFMACLYVGAIAVPLYPPRSNRNLQRIRAIIKDSQAKFALTTSLIHKNIQGFDDKEIFNDLEFILTDESIENELNSGILLSKNELSDLAFLQYTSGSTASPKGVMVSHGNLLANIEAIKNSFDQDESSIIVSWLPLFHDMGLIGNLLQTIYTGSQCVLMSPTAFLQKPLEWLKAISRFRATTSGAPNFGYELCNRITVSDEDAQQIDLSTWKTAFCGAEPVRVETLTSFGRKFAPNGFNEKSFAPCYGLAEATLLVSVSKGLQSLSLSQRDLAENRVKIGASINKEKQNIVTSCGKIINGHKVKIIDPETKKELPENAVGEIVFSGESVAKGYWNNDAETNSIFQILPEIDENKIFLRSGDLGFLSEKSLFVTGRLKDLIIMRGKNIYPQDLEFTAAKASEKLSAANIAAFSVAGDASEAVCLILEAERKTEFEKIASTIVRLVADEHEIRLNGIAFVRRGSLPKTSSGKLMRTACCRMFEKSELNLLYQWSETDRIEENLTEFTFETANKTTFSVDDLKCLVSERLRLNTHEIDESVSLTELGIDSLTATEISLQAEEIFEVTLSVADILQGKSLREIAENAPQIYKLQTAKISDPQSVSHGQKAIYFLQQLSPQSTAYNIQIAVSLINSVDLGLLEIAVRLSLENHEQIRSNFKQEQGKIHRFDNDLEKFEFVRIKYQETDPEIFKRKIGEKVNLPFDLEKDVLIRGYLIENISVDVNQTIFVLNAHHIICDFRSLRLLADEIGKHYSNLKNSKSVTETFETTEFSTFAANENAFLASRNGKISWNFWKEKLSGEIQTLDLPTDYSRPAFQKFQGDSINFEISDELTEKLEHLARKNQVTFFSLLLASYRIFLAKYSGQNDFLIGVPNANRTNREASKTFGYFVNALPIRGRIHANTQFQKILAETNFELNSAAAHAVFPFSLMVERLSPEREASRSPLFQTTFTWQQTALGNTDWEAIALGNSDELIKFGEIECRAFSLPQISAQFDLSLQAAKLGEKLYFVWQYDTVLFKSATIELWSKHFRNLLNSIVNQPNAKISEIELLSETEKQKQIVDWNATEKTYETGILLNELIERQVEKTPQNIAVEFENDTLTYSELNAKANQLAHYLRKKGIGAESVVGVALRRSTEMVVALLGVVKAGAAYLPIDPSYPRERFVYMLDDAKVTLLLTTSEIADEFQINENISCVLLESDVYLNEETANLSRVATPENAAYVIYTSGSTGKPKGAINSHSNIVNRILWMQEAFGIDETDAVLQKTPFSFDVSVWEFFWTLMFGARLVVAKPDGHTDAQYLLKTIEEKSITTLHFVPSMLNLFLQESERGRGRNLRRVICSGEALPHELQQNFFKKFEKTELHNLYGPTEAAIDVSWHICQRESALKTVPIGKPIANTQLYVLDERLCAVPVGVAGELFIGGANVGRGYLNKPALTAEKFIPDPFSSQNGARLYRTGDIVRFLSDGSIEYLERRDGQIKLRGQRIELGEIQTVLQSHSLISDAAVTVSKIEADQSVLTAYYVAEKELRTSELREFMSEKLPRQMIPNYFIKLGKMPLSPNGKLDRKALPLPKSAKSGTKNEFAAPENETQAVLANIWREVLNLEKIGIDDNFFNLGGDSIRSIQVRSKAREKGLDFELSELFRFQTVRTLSTVLRFYKSDENDRDNKLLNDDDLKKLPPDAVDAYPLTRLQTALVFHQEHDRDYEIYVTSLRVSAKFDEKQMENAVAFVTERHEILRSSFDMSGFSEPLQVVFEKIKPNFEIFDLRQKNAREHLLNDWLEKERVRTFNWNTAPLARFTIHILGFHEFQLTLSEPVLDGWSVATLLTDLLTVYAALNKSEESPQMPEKPKYSEYVRLEKMALKSEAQTEFWRKNLSGFKSCLAPLEKLSEQIAANQTERIYVGISDLVSEKIIKLAEEMNVPLKTILLSVHLRAISLLYGQTDICTGLLYNGRPETLNSEKSVGLYLNAVPFRLNIGGLDFAEIAVKAFEAETELLPFRRFPLSEILRIHRRREMFDTAFNYTHFHAYQSLRAIDGIEVKEIYASDQTYFPLTSQFNLNHESEKPDIRLAIDFRPAKIPFSTAQKFADYLSAILKEIAGIVSNALPETKNAAYFSAAANSKIQAIKESDEIAELVAKLEQMSDEEVRSLKEKLKKNI